MPGTEVKIAISPKRQAEEERRQADEAAMAAVRDRMRELFLTTKRFRNAPRVSREELYDRARDR